METLAVFHILKNGGTTLLDRYKHNDKFVYQRVKNELVYNYQQPNQKRIQTADVTSIPTVVFGHGVSFDWDVLATNNVKYATILRNPRNRIISAFNYFRLEMNTIHETITDIDFRTWFINRSRLLPTPVFYQLQTFTDMPTSCLYSNYGRTLNNKLLLDLYAQAIKNIDKIDYVFFMGDDYINKFDKLMSTYNLTPAQDITHTHNTKYHLDNIGVSYITYDQLNNNDKDLLDSHLHIDSKFYEYCREKFK